ncbi:MAG: hypothetical protein EPN84_00275 [Legionella sp.]|nr:MAG: hypothetical protein EPN84_00275 [Legionella sp.]
MWNKALICSLVLLFSPAGWAFTCYYNLAKGSCWGNYDVTVNVIDTEKSTVLLTVQIPKGKFWVQQQFPCDPAQKLMYQAKFNPVFWESDKNKVYSALRYWFMPGEINSGDSAWTIPVCFPKDFAEVPLPPDAPSGDCPCDFSTFPVIKPK